MSAPEARAGAASRVDLSTADALAEALRPFASFAHEFHPEMRDAEHIAYWRTVDPITVGDCRRAALILAEIERLDRAEARAQTTEHPHAR